MHLTFCIEKLGRVDIRFCSIPIQAACIPIHRILFIASPCLSRSRQCNQASIPSAANLLANHSPQVRNVVPLKPHKSVGIGVPLRQAPKKINQKERHDHGDGTSKKRQSGPEIDHAAQQGTRDPGVPSYSLVLITGGPDAGQPSAWRWINPGVIRFLFRRASGDARMSLVSLREKTSWAHELRAE